MPGTIRTAADGTYSSGVTVPGERKVTFEPPVGWKEQTRLGVALSAGTQRLDVELAKWGSVSGQITLRDGGTVAPARGQVLIHRLADWGWGWSGWAVWTDDQGRYTVPSLEGAVRLSYSVGGAFEEFWNDGSGDADAEIITVAPGQDITGVDVEVDAWANVAADIRYRASRRRARAHRRRERLPLEAGRGIGLLRAGVRDTLPVGGSLHLARAPCRDVRRAVHRRAQVGHRLEYYSDARYFYERTDVVVQAGDMIELGEVILEPRYFDVGRIAGRTGRDGRGRLAVVIPDGQRAPVVLLTSGMNFPDALSAGPVAIRGGGVVSPPHPTGSPTLSPTSSNGSGPSASSSSAAPAHHQRRRGGGPLCRRHLHSGRPDRRADALRDGRAAHPGRLRRGEQPCRDHRDRVELP